MPRERAVFRTTSSMVFATEHPMCSRSGDVTSRPWVGESRVLMPKYRTALGWLLSAMAVAWLFVASPAVPVVVAAEEGSVTATVVVECTDSLENPTVVLQVDASNGTPGAADLSVTISGNTETKTIPAGGSTTFGGDTGQKSVPGGEVVLQTTGTIGSITYGAKTCPSGTQVYGPIELFVAPPTTQPAGSSLTVEFAGCPGVRVTGTTPEATLLRVIIDGENLSVDLSAGDFDLFFENPSQDKAAVEAVIELDGLHEARTLYCEVESSSQESTTPSATITVSSEETLTSSTGETTTASSLEPTTSEGSTTVSPTTTKSTESSGHEPPTPPGPYAQPSLSASTPDCTTPNLTANAAGTGVVPASVVVAPGQTKQLPVVAEQGYFFTDGGVTETYVEVANPFDASPCVTPSSVQPSVDAAQPAKPVCVVVVPAGIDWVADSQQIQLVYAANGAAGATTSGFKFASGDTSDAGSGWWVRYGPVGIVVAVVVAAFGFALVASRRRGAHQ